MLKGQILGPNTLLTLVNFDYEKQIYTGVTEIVYVYMEITIMHTKTKTYQEYVN